MTEVLEPGTPGYEAARKPAMARYHDIRPRAVVRCASDQDVAWALGYARDSGLHVVPRGGGHCFAGRSSTEGAVLDLTPLRSVEVSPDGLATIGAGARLAEVYDALDQHGRTLPAGCGPTVGIAGLTLGGGLGLLGRKYGLTCDRLRAARVVLTDGRVVDCDTDREPELFWALRGAGGGQFGVVTSLVFATVPAPRATRIVVTWPFSEAAALVEAWQQWAPDAPDELNANLKVAPPLVVLFGAMLGTQAETVALLEELGPLPASASVTEMPYRELKASLDDLGPPAPADLALTTSKSEFFRRPLPTDAITGLLDALGPHRELNFTPLGGAYNRVPADATAFVHRTERFLLEHVAVHSATDTPDWVRQSWARAHERGSGRVYPNFPDPDLDDWAEAYHGPNLTRLMQVKRTYDPDNVLHFPQSISPAISPAG